MSDAPSAAVGTARRAAVRLVPPRSDRLQVCVTPEEKSLLAEQARRAGYETLSDYVRARTLGPRDQQQQRSLGRP